MLEKESQHFARGVGSARIGVGPGGAAARPGMAGPVDDPLFEHRLAGRVEVEAAAIIVPAGHPALFNAYPQIRARRRRRLRNDLIAVAGMHGRVAIAVEHDGRHEAPIFLGASGPA